MGRVIECKSRWVDKIDKTGQEAKYREFWPCPPFDILFNDGLFLFFFNRTYRLFSEYSALLQ